MIKWNLQDTFFQHIPYSVPGVASVNVEWDRTNLVGTTFYSHEKMLEPFQFNSGTNYGLLIESQGIIPDIYQKIITNKLYEKFDRVFTHSSAILNAYDKARWIPGGGIWVGGTYGGGEIKMYPKSKLCSIVCSDKQMCQLHRTRIAITEIINTFGYGIDTFGTHTGKWVPIIDSLKDYRFSVIVENFIDDAYFTEKILNCFATGTIPIYMGARNISQYFNADGIIQFNNPGDFTDIILDISKALYNSKLSAITDNFNECKKYRLIEDYILDTYLKG